MAKCTELSARPANPGLLPAIRDAKPADAAAILQTHREAILGLTDGFYTREVIEEWAAGHVSPERVAAFARAIANREELIVVAADSSDRILGFGSIVPANNELRAVYVHPKYTRQGVGRAILRRLEELARSVGMTELQMAASINAEAFYAANGFVAQTRGEHTLSSGGRMACVRMRKPLSG
jgi:putative acetyltransferase